MDQVFAVRQVCEKCHANVKNGIWAFMDFENPYDIVDRHDMGQMLRVGKLLKAGQSFYADSRACVQVGNDMSEWFPVNVGLIQPAVVCR